MKFLLALIFTSFAQDSCPEITEQNKQLQDSLYSIRNQLHALTRNPEQVLQDFIQNKERLQSLIFEFSNNPVRLSIAEDINEVLRRMSEDMNLLDYSPEGVSQNTIKETINDLANSIHKARIYSENKEFSRIYNQLMVTIDENAYSIKTLQMENALLLGKLESAKAENEAISKMYENEKNLRIETQADLQALKIDHSNRIEIIENALSNEEKESRSEEIENFQNIQNSQNKLISELQAANAELTLKLEQKVTELSTSQNALNIEESNSSNLKKELKSRDDQLLDCEVNYEDFRRKVEIENNDQILVLRESQQSLQNEIQKLQEERETILDDNKNCTQELSEVLVEDRLKENVIKGLRNDLDHATESVDSAKSARTQELAILTQNVEDLQESLEKMQEQYDEALEKVLQQSTQIRELQEKVADYEYISSRNLRG